jgi:hypothetical protein
MRTLLSIPTMVAVLLAAGCGGDEDPTSTRDPNDFSLPLDYSADEFWLCRPGLEEDHCLMHDLAATAMLPDGSTEREDHVVAEDPEYDCFYVYPTVDLTGPVGNHTDFSDVRPMLDPLLSQAARFTGQCRVFAPLYRQITILTYLASSSTETYLERAYVDVEAAFAHYLTKYAGDRPFVIMGHSQGAHMTRRLVQRVVADDPQLRSRMIAALLIGGDMAVAEGEVTGGFFDDIPLCTEVEETGCILAYRSYAEGFPPPDGSNSTDSSLEGSVPACTNPADLSGARRHFAGTYLPTSAHQSAFDAGELIGELSVDTGFVLYRDFYTGECVADGTGAPYLEVGVEPLGEDTRENLIPFDAAIFSPSFLGLHVLDYNFALGDLMMLVDAKAAALP